jgi:ABC-2 type transport system permease protein
VSRRAAVEAFRTGARRTLAERGGLAVSVLFYVVVVATLSALWRFAVHAHHGSLGGYTAVALTWYLVTSETATVALNTRLIEDVAIDVAGGTIAVELLRPASVLGLRVAAELGRAVPKALVLWCSGAVVAAMVAGAPPRPLTLVLVAPSLLLAMLVNLLGQHAVAAVTFWLRDAGSLWFLWLKAVFITGGLLIPLELLPSGLERASFVLPFWAMAYAPARIAAGHAEPWLVVGQVAWALALAAVAAVAFRAGERHLQVVGG